MTTRTILVIDDDDDIRDIVAMSLELASGWQVLGEARGADAVSRAAEVNPDAILLDVNLGDVDGPTVLAALRADSRTREIPVVFLTAKVRPAEVGQLRALGAGVLAKPFDPLTLHEQVGRELGWTA